jgi:hypothetical protein
LARFHSSHPYNHITFPKSLLHRLNHLSSPTLPQEILHVHLHDAATQSQERRSYEPHSAPGLSGDFCRHQLHYSHPQRIRCL